MDLATLLVNTGAAAAAMVLFYSLLRYELRMLKRSLDRLDESLSKLAEELARLDELVRVMVYRGCRNGPGAEGGKGMRGDRH